MAYDITNVRGEAASTRIKQFAVDSASEISSLPTQTTKGTSLDGQGFEEDYVDTGSTAICSDGSVFYLFPAGWKQL